MGKWMLAVVVLAGCGLEVAAPIVDVPQEKLALVGPTAAPQQTFEAIPRHLGQARHRDAVNVEVQLGGLSSDEGKTVTAVIGQMSCGFLVEATATGVVRDGVARIRLPAGADTSHALMLLIDSDGDGKCSESDVVFGGEVTAAQLDVGVLLDAKSLTPSANWLCYVL